MADMLQHACKEWAAICKALAAGKQVILLRKGGIDEETGEFVLQHKRFWLYPTYLHQSLIGVHPQAQVHYHLSLLARPPEGQVALESFAEVTAIYELHDMVGAYKLQPFHCWSQEVVESRFRYRRPGLWALVTRVFTIPQAHEIAETSVYAGCKSWVELEAGLSTEGAVPVVGDADYQRLCGQIHDVLKPEARA